MNRNTADLALRLVVCILSAASMTAFAAAPAHSGQSDGDFELIAEWSDVEFSVQQANDPDALSEDDVFAQYADHEIGIGLTRGLVSVLVQYELAAVNGVDHRPAIRNFARQNGGKVQYEYNTVLPDVVNLRNIPREKLDALRAMPGVLRVDLDEYHPNLVNLHDSTPLIRGLQSQITGAGLSADGAGVRVCVADTGIDSDHIMYSSRIDASAGYDFYNDDSNPEDDNGHGTHVSGIAVGGTGITWDPCATGPEPFQGIAPEATLIGSKILNSGGGGFDSDIIAGIDHCADQSPSGGQADVINLSIGTGNFGGICTHSWAVASNNAVANGVVVVAASGNENNSNSMGSPACGVDVIAVGATYKADYPTCEDNITNWNWGSCVDNSPNQDQIVCFSNESDFLDVAAPGANIWSASNAAGGGSIVGNSGTSMASPQVAGLAALILGVDPTLTPAEVRQIIRDGAIDMGTTGFDRAYGWGRIDVINSLNLLAPCTGDPDCDDGLFCNGAETCDGQSCQPGSDPCPGQSCDEGADQCVAAPQVVYSWDMNTNPGWTMQGQWAWGQPTGGGGQHGGPDPTSGFTGSIVVGYNLNGDYPNNLAETHLTTQAIDCTDLVDVSVQFRRWLGVEVDTYDHAYFRVSTNGTSWTTIWQNGPQVAETSWSLQSFDISSIADGQPTVYLRWTMGTTDSSWQYCGWNLDDVEIWASDTGGGCTVPADCDDGLYCNGAEDCVAGSCVAGTPPDCDDGVGCTDDSCNEGTDSCDNIENDANCDNGLFCDGAETCDAVNDCQAGAAPDCDDGVGCTDDSCNEGTDSCDNIANDGSCDNGLYCDGAEFCDTVNDCQAGTAPNCDDGIACTDDSCNEAADTCDNVENDGACDDGLFCNGAETCDAGLGCLAGSDPCPGQGCDEGTDTCVDCVGDGDCDDGLFCNGAETCVAGTCQAGTAPDCDDGVGCTDDSCNEGTDSCDNVVNDGNCDDGLFCNGAESCDAVLDCQAGSDPCGGDPCDEVNDVCDGGGGAELWMSFRSNTAVPGVGTVADEDIVSYDIDSDTWSLVFDGSDVGLGGLEISAMTPLASGEILMSFTAPGTVGGLSVDDSDIVIFTPTSLGSNTAGSFAVFFDGSDVDLSSNGEDVDALSLADDGRLIVSTTGRFRGTGASGADEDLFIFTDTSLGTTTAGTFAIYFDGSDVGLNNSSSEDVDAAGLTSSGSILFSTLGNFNVAGVSGADEDVVEFVPTSLGTSTSGSFSMFLDLSALGIATNEDIGSLALID